MNLVEAKLKEVLHETVLLARFIAVIVAIIMSALLTNTFSDPGSTIKWAITVALPILGLYFSAGHYPFIKLLIGRFVNISRGTHND
jgi:hypothetical protein